MYLREFDIQLSKDNGAIFLLLIKEFISGFNKIKKIQKIIIINNVLFSLII